MAKVYLAYRRGDEDIATAVSRNLGVAGHESVLPHHPTSVASSADRERIIACDIYVPLITEAAAKFRAFRNEGELFRSVASLTGDKIIVPVLINVPKEKVYRPYRDLLCYSTQNPTPDEITRKILEHIVQFESIQEAKRQQQEKDAERIEARASEYIDEAIAELRSVERRDRILGYICYTAGFLCLLVGIWLGWYNAQLAAQDQTESWIRMAQASVKYAIIIGLLAYGSKYALSLGRSYTGESTRTSNRIHAISFGRFFLRAYGDKASLADIKEAFQHWNIDRSQEHGKADSDLPHADSKTTEALTVLIKALATK